MLKNIIFYFSLVLFSACTGHKQNATDDTQSESSDSITDSASAAGSDSESSSTVDSTSASETESSCEYSVDLSESSWVTIPAGTFTFGSPPEGTPCRGFSEQQVEVTITRSFKMASTEITQAQWEAACIPNPSKTVGPDRPVERVDWFEALAYCNRMSEAAGLDTCYDLSSCTGILGGGCPPEVPEYCTHHSQCDPSWYFCIENGYFCTGEVHKYRPYSDCPGYRLPTTAEWEYAARAGTTGHTYNGDVQTPEDSSVCVEEPTLEPIAWYCFNSNGVIQPVAQKEPNAWGLYDILGNGGEWTDYLTNQNGLEAAEGLDGPLTDPSGGISSTSQMDLRGGDPFTRGCELRSARQFGRSTFTRGIGYGFRPVRTIMEEK